MKLKSLRYNSLFADRMLAGSRIFLYIAVLAACALRPLLQKLFDVLHIRLHADPDTALDLETAGGLNTIVINTAAAAGGILLGVLLVMLLYRPTKQDRKRMANAKQPKWRQVSRNDMEMIRQQNRHILWEVCGLFVILTVLLILCGIPADFSFEWQVGAGCVFSVTAIETGIMLYHHRIWRQIDETAECAVVPVYKNIVKGRRNKIHYMVCYLPDGKYMLENRSGRAHPATVHIIRYRGLLRCIPH